MGLLLVVAATALGGLVVARSDHTVPMYAAASPLVPGDPVRTEDLRRVDVHLGTGVTTYLSAAGALPADAFVVRPVAAGELVPMTAIGPHSAVTTRILAVPVDPAAAALVERGSIVDVYVNRPVNSTVGASADYQGPELSLAAATVAAVPEATSSFVGPSARRTVQLVVPTASVQTLVADMDAGAKLTLVPVPTAGARAP